MMRIYEGDTGKLTFDSDRELGDGTRRFDDRVPGLVDNDVTFFFAPTETSVLAQFVSPGESSPTPRRMVVEYDPGGAAISLTDFRSMVGEFLNESKLPSPRECRTDRDRKVQEGFLAMKSPYVDSPEIEAVLGDRLPVREPLTVGVPSVESAVDAVGYLLERDDASVAISFDGRTEYLDEGDGVDVVVHPDAAHETIRVVDEAGTSRTSEGRDPGHETPGTDPPTGPSADERRPRDDGTESDRGRESPSSGTDEPGWASTSGKAGSDESVGPSRSPESGDEADAGSGRPRRRSPESAGEAGPDAPREDDPVESTLPGPSIETNGRSSGEPVMRIFDGPGGVLVYDSTDRLEEGSKISRANETYNDDVLLYVDPAAGDLFVYTNGQVGRANQQLVVQYSARPGEDLIERFYEDFEATLEEHGWSVLRDAGDWQTVFNDLPDAEPREPEVDEEELAALLERDDPIDFGAPSARSAVRFVTYLRSREDFDGSVAICAHGRTDELADTDVVVMPSAISFDAVEPRSDTREFVSIGRLDDRLDRARTALATIDEQLRESRHTNVERQQILSDAIEGSDTDDWSIAFRASMKLTQLSRTAIGVVPAALGVLVALLLGVFSGTSSEFVVQLQSRITVPFLPAALPVATPGYRALTLPSWAVIIAGLVALGATGLLTSRVLDVSLPRFAPATGQALERLRHDSVADAVPRLDPELSELQNSLAAVDDLVEDIDESSLEENFDFAAAEANEPAEVVVESRLGDTVDDLDVVDRERFSRNRRIWLLSGLLGGSGVGVLTVGAIAGVALGLLTYWESIVGVLWAVTRILAVVALAGGLLAVGWRAIHLAIGLAGRLEGLRSGRSSEPFGRGSDRQSAADGAEATADTTETTSGEHSSPPESGAPPDDVVDPSDEREPTGSANVSVSEKTGADDTGTGDLQGGSSSPFVSTDVLLVVAVAVSMLVGGGIPLAVFVGLLGPTVGLAGVTLPWYVPVVPFAVIGLAALVTLLLKAI